MARICRAPSRFEGTCGTCGQYGHRLRYCIRNQPAPYAHVIAAPVAPPAPSAPAFSVPPTGGGDGSYGGGAYDRGYGDGSYGGGAYGYGGSDGGYSDGAYSGPYDHGGHGGAGYEAVPVGQSPGGGGGGYDIPSRPPAAPDRGFHRSIQQAGDGGDGVAFAAEDGATRMKDISVVLFPPFSVARNWVLAPLLMPYSSQLPSRASFPTSCLRFSRRNVLALQP